MIDLAAPSAVRGPETLTLARDGAELHSGMAAGVIDTLADLLAHLPADQPGLRLRDIPGLAEIVAAEGVLGALAALHLGSASRPVRAILFDKTERTNWALGWHQDRTICVEKRRDVAGFGPWSIKQGMQHVEPPFALLETMITMRVHLDDVGEGNAPLLIAPGSHRLGKLMENEIAPAVQRCGIFSCTAYAGDVWLYATPVLHASPAATPPSHRRVLQLDFSAQSLPAELAWLGI